MVSRLLAGFEAVVSHRGNHLSRVASAVFVALGRPRQPTGSVPQPGCFEAPLQQSAKDNPQAARLRGGSLGALLATPGEGRPTDCEAAAVLEPLGRGTTGSEERPLCSQAPGHQTATDDDLLADRHRGPSGVALDPTCEAGLTACSLDTSGLGPPSRGSALGDSTSLETGDEACGSGNDPEDRLQPRHQGHSAEDPHGLTGSRAEEPQGLIPEAACTSVVSPPLEPWDVCSCQRAALKVYRFSRTQRGLAELLHRGMVRTAASHARGGGPGGGAPPAAMRLDDLLAMPEFELRKLWHTFRGSIFFSTG